MKRLLIVINFCCLIALAFCGTSAVFAESYLEPTSTLNPHGGYTTSTNKCKYCHAVHLASGSYMLTRANTVLETCDYCHGDGSGAGTIVVSNFEGHTMSKNTLFFGTAPGYTDSDKFVSTPESPFTCMTCHSVHADPERIVVLADLDKNYLLLRNPDSTDTSYGPTNTLSEWCADCHPLMLGSNETTKIVDGNIFFSHSSSSTAVTTYVVSAEDGMNFGPSCRQCHSSSLFPHGQGGSGRDMLKDSFDGINLDSVCIDCHPENSLP